MKPLIFLFSKGMFIGLANLVPGLTLATAAFLMSVYIPGLQALRAVNITALRYLREKRWHDLAAHVNWKIWATIPLGIIICGFLLPALLPLRYEITAHLPEVYAILSGLTLGSVGFALAGHRGAGFIGFMLFIGGILAGTLPLVMPLPALPVSWEYQPLHGMVATIAQLIPGLPESSSLTLLNQYSATTYYADRGYWPAILLFMLGVFGGLVIMLLLLALLLRRFQEQTFSLLYGLTAAVALQLWPLGILQSNEKQALLSVLLCFLGGVAASGLMQFFQRRTLG